MMYYVMFDDQSVDAQPTVDEARAAAVRLADDEPLQVACVWIADADGEEVCVVR